MSKRFKAFLACALFAAALESFSCSVLSFEELEASVSVGERQNYYAQKYVAFNFSIGVNTSQAQTIFALKEDGSAAEADFIWAEKAFLVQARGGFKKGRKYSVSLNGGLLTNDGRTYSVALFREFVYGEESEIFCVKKVEEPQKVGSPKGALAITFNKAVDAAVFEREFNLSPSLEVKKSYSADMKRVEIVPADKWKANLYYTWRLGKTRSKDGAKIDREWSGSFMAVEKNEAPKLLCVCPVLESGAFLEGRDLNGILEKQAVGFVFDSNMDFESVQSGIYWSPFVNGYWTKADSRRFFFTPYDNYKIGEEYTVTVSEAVEDTLGLCLKESANVRFSAQSQFIEASVFLNGNPLVPGKVNAARAAQGCPLLFTLEFSRALDKKSIAGFKSAVSLAPHFPLDIASPNLESVKALGGNGSALQVEFGNFDFSEGGEEKIYAFTISGGKNFVYDAYGEYLKEDACFYVLLEK